MITGENFIGSRRSALSSIQFKTFNPLLNIENEWIFTEANESEIEEATSKAWKAFKFFRKVTDEDRALFLDTIATEIEALGDELIQTYVAESGLPESRARIERGRTLFQLRSFATYLRTNWKETTVENGDPQRNSGPKPDLRKTMIPLGPIVVFGSSNFPLAYSTAGGDTASALAAGCPVIVKSHPMHAGTGELVASAIIAAAQKTNMPDGVFSNLNSKGIEVGVQLVKDPKVKAVGFTGSINGGRAIYNLATQREEPIPVFAEMGSINPVVISPEILKNKAEHWAETYAGSITLGTGQFCTNPGLILAIEGDGLGLFKEALARKIIEIEPSVMLHPNIKTSFSNLKLAVTNQPGVKTITETVDVKTNFADQTVATVSGTEFLKNPKLHQEVFGPFSLIVTCENQNELIQIIEGLEGQLTGTVILEDDEFEPMKEVIDALQYRVGRLIYNGVPTGVEVCSAMHHGGPYPATTDSRFTAVGIQSIRRWVRPITYQNFPNQLLPAELKK